jgi:LmbE family N-acetylglucosaminyl deacetylase
MKDISRRDLLKMAGTATGVSALGMKPFSIEQVDKSWNKSGKTMIVVGGHPGDPEVCCGGTIALFAQNGFDVVTAYLNRGEAGIHGKTMEEAGKIRTGEAIAACKILHSRPVFLTQVDGSSEINESRYNEMYDLLKKESPRLVFAHWPIDSHRDHRNSSLLVYDAWARLGKSFDLFFYEVELGKETQNFAPTDYINIASVRDLKHAASNCHVSQGIEEVFKNSHDLMERLRGMEANFPYAEAFVKHLQSPSNGLMEILHEV